MATEIRYWKKLERHPLSAEYPDVHPATRELMRERLKQHGIILGRKVILASENGRGKPKVLDGWQLLQACIDEDVKPSFQMLPKNIPAEDFVEIVNDCRRDEGDMKVKWARADARRKRVAERRQQGESIRTIAEAEKVSPATIHEDLKVLTVQGEQSMPLDGQVKGKDKGRKQPALKPKKICERCQRVGVVKDCPACAELRGRKGREPGEDDKKDTSKPKQGEVLFDFKEFESDFGRLLRQVDKLGKAYRCKESKEAGSLRKKLVDWMHEFKDWAKEVKNG